MENIIGHPGGVDLYIHRMLPDIRIYTFIFLYLQLSHIYIYIERERESEREREREREREIDGERQLARLPWWS